MLDSWLSVLSNVHGGADIPRAPFLRLVPALVWALLAVPGLSSAGAEALCPVGDQAPPSETGKRSPNIVLIAVDTLRADRLGLYGHSRPTSKALDRLAGHAWVYDHAVSPAPWTTPSFAAILTGRSPGSLGLTERPIPLPREVETLAEGLKNRGYATAGIVSHLFVGRQYGFDRGFDFWDQRHAGGHTYVSSAAVADLGTACLGSLASTGKPFFLFAHFFDPHYDFIAHPEHAFGEPYEGPLKVGNDNFEQLRQLARRGMLSAADRRHLFDLYDSEIAYTDAHIGRLLRELERRGLYDDTVVVMVADHGEMLGERDGRAIGHTQYLYEELIRVPFLLKLPGAEPPHGRVPDVVGLVDLTPTLLMLAGAPGPAPSRSLIPDGGGRVARRQVFSQTRRWRRLDAIYEGSWKLIVDQSSGRRLLFDLSRDPLERKSLRRREPARVVRMEKALEAHLARQRRDAAALADRAEPALTPEQLKALKALGYGG